MSDSLKSPPPGETAHLHLRPLDWSDAKALHDMTDDSVITSAIPFLTTPFALSDAQNLIRSQENGRNCFFAAWPREHGQLACVVGAHLRTGNKLGIGYWVASQFRGKGYATESAGAIIEILRRELPAREIIAKCRPENRPPWHILEIRGFGRLVKMERVQAENYWR